MAPGRNGIATILIGLFILGLTDVPDVWGADALLAVSSRGPSAVAVGEGGRILRAYPAPHNGAWIGVGSPVATSLRAVTPGGTDYFAVGDAGQILQSTDVAGQGAAWITRESGTTLDLFGIAHGNLRMVAVGDSGSIFLSYNLEGGAWQRVSPENIETRKPLRSAAGNQNYVVAVGDSGTVVWSRSLILLVWERPDPPRVPTTQDLLAIASEPVGTTIPRFYAVGRAGTILLSSSVPSDAWELQPTPTSADLHAVAMYRVLPDNTLTCVAVGDGGTILRSVDMSTWTEIESGTQRDLYGVAYTGSGAGGGFVAVGEENTVLWSPTGLSWSNPVVPIEGTTWGRIRGAWRNPSPDR